MNDKQEKVIQYLSQQSAPCTTLEIADALGIKEFAARVTVVGLTKETPSHKAILEEVQVEREIINSRGEYIITTVLAYKIK